MAEPIPFRIRRIMVRVAQIAREMKRRGITLDMAVVAKLRRTYGK